ncbi:MAG: hypothetical protein J4432_03120 [DPANN group archaeon]|nr:hypothetical protein [DPANN group archaeon]
MENQNEKKVVLCDDCDHCPEVITNTNGATIGEDDNIVKLKPIEWNLLVDNIQNGTLTKIN